MVLKLVLRFWGIKYDFSNIRYEWIDRSGIFFRTYVEKRIIITISLKSRFVVCVAVVGNSTAYICVLDI